MWPSIVGDRLDCSPKCPAKFTPPLCLFYQLLDVGLIYSMLVFCQHFWFEYAGIIANKAEGAGEPKEMVPEFVVTIKGKFRVRFWVSNRWSVLVSTGVHLPSRIPDSAQASSQIVSRQSNGKRKLMHMEDGMSVSNVAIVDPNNEASARSEVRILNFRRFKNSFSHPDRLRRAHEFMSDREPNQKACESVW